MKRIIPQTLKSKCAQNNESDFSISPLQKEVANLLTHK